MALDLLLRQGRRADEEAPVDIAIASGRIVEIAEGRELFSAPRMPYTKMLLGAVPDLAMSGRQRVPVKGEIPNPIDPPKGCAFNPRCPQAFDLCRKQTPELIDGVAREELETLGIEVITGWSASADDQLAAADLVVAPDDRVPFLAGLGLGSVGLEAGGPDGLSVDRRGRTSHPDVFAAGDVTGGAIGRYASPPAEAAITTGIFTSFTASASAWSSPSSVHLLGSSKSRSKTTAFAPAFSRKRTTWPQYSRRQGQGPKSPLRRLRSSTATTTIGAAVRSSGARRW